MVKCVVNAAQASKADSVVVVTGYHSSAVKRELHGVKDISIVHNKNYRQGIGASLARGLHAMPGETEGVLVCLGDMPFITSRLLDKMIDAYNPSEARALYVPVYHGVRGNPVLIGQELFESVIGMSGDTGASRLLEAEPELQRSVEMCDDAILVDVDTAEALKVARLREI